MIVYFNEDWNGNLGQVYSGPNAENDAKLATMAAKKQYGSDYNIVVRQRKADRYSEAGIAVVCIPTPEKVARDKAERQAQVEKDKRNPNYLAFYDNEYDYQRKPRPRRKKEKPRRRFSEFVGVSISHEDDSNLPLPSQSTTREGMRRRIRSDKNPGSPPTHLYWYGEHGRRWGGRGKKAPKRNWKWLTKQRKQYLSI